MHIGSVLRDDQGDTLSPFKKRTLPTSRVGNGNELDDPFGPSDVNASPNSFLESIQQQSTGNVPRGHSEVSPTQVSLFVRFLPHSDLTLVQETEAYRLRIQAIDSQQAQTAHDEIVSLRSDLQGSSAEAQGVEWSLKRAELTRASLEHRLTDSDTRLSTVFQDLDQARETISVLEQQAVEKAAAASRAELDRDSAEADVTSLREQVQSLETAIVSEKSVATDLKDDLQKTSERKDAFEAAANAKDQEIRRLEQEIDCLRRQIEESITLKGKLLHKILGLESTLCETKAELSATQEDASRLTTSLVESKASREGFLEQVASLRSSLAQQRTESTQELSNLRNATALSLAEKQTQVSELEFSLVVAESSLAELQDRLGTVTLSMEGERNALRSDISSLQQSLEESGGAVSRLESSHEASRLSLQSVTKELDGKRSELEALQGQSMAEAQRLAALAGALEEARGRRKRAEEEIVTMKAAKRADDEAIRRVAASYNKLRKLHVECLAEMDGLVGAVQT
jgi:chromosome segregation ATPase